MAETGWGPWRLDAETRVLRAGDDEVDLEELTTSAQVLDWLCQVAGKSWGDDSTLAGLVRAIDDILDPQSYLCRGGRSGRLTRAQIRESVQRHGWTPQPPRPRTELVADGVRLHVEVSRGWCRAQIDRDSLVDISRLRSELEPETAPLLTVPEDVRAAADRCDDAGVDAIRAAGVDEDLWGGRASSRWYSVRVPPDFAELAADALRRAELSGEIDLLDQLTMKLRTWRPRRIGIAVGMARERHHSRRSPWPIKLAAHWCRWRGMG